MSISSDDTDKPDIPSTLEGSSPCTSPPKSCEAHAEAQDSHHAKAGAAFYVVGVGASAGGLEALEQLFNAIPHDTGMAFVVVQHLSPDFESHMEALLGRQTPIKIYRVEDQMVVQPDSIYLLPPKMEMIITDGKLQLIEKSPERTFSQPIDRFFRSLAHDFGPYSVGVVLSGTGSDGSRGIRDIHDAGGLVLSQSLETAKFDGMPRSSQSTGVVDFVLSPQEMATALSRYAREGRLSSKLTDDQSHLNSGFDRIFELLLAKHGLDFTDYRGTTIERRIQRRMNLLGLNSLQEYFHHLQNDSTELHILYKDLLIGVTKFFRDPEAFEALRTTVIPKLFRQTSKANPVIRVWVAGCSTGEEAYSLAMLIDEERRRLDLEADVKIFATDVNRISIQFASRGIFSEESVGELHPERKARYFRPFRDEFVVTPELRRCVIFAPHNMLEDAPFTQMDMVTCRNLLIYLQPPIQKRALTFFHFALKPNGVLFLGPSETPGSLAEEFESINKRWRIYQKTRDIRLPAHTNLSIGKNQSSQNLPQATQPKQNLTRTDYLLRIYDQLLDRSMPPSILVGQSLEIIHIFGGAESFLEFKVGRPTLSLQDVIHRDLRVAVTSSLQRAVLNPTNSPLAPIRTPWDGNSIVHVSAEAIKDPLTSTINYLIKFDSSSQHPAPQVNSELVQSQNSDESLDRIASLETELRYSQENLQSTVEELETSNEELQATNEELVASNEELQSTNEELHSVNEELYTVNSEFQRQVVELAQANNDMDNLLALTRVGVLYLDEKFAIRRFTPEIARVLQLVSHDVGRSVESFTHHLNYPSLIGDLREIQSGHHEKEVDIVAKDGAAYLLRMLPYHSNGQVNGVVLTLIDVSRLRKTQLELARFKFMAESAADMQILLNQDGRFEYANPSFCKLIGIPSDELLLLTKADVSDIFDNWIYQDRFASSESDACLIDKIRTRNGLMIPVEISCNPVEFDGQSFLYATLRDITQRLAAEVEIRLHKTALDSAAVGILITDFRDNNHPIIYANSGFTEMSGYPLQEVLGTNCRFLQGPDTDRSVVDRLRKAINEGRSARTLLKNYRKDGTPFWNDLIVAPVRDSSGEVSHFVGVQNDVTERIELYIRLQVVLDTTVEGIYGVDTNGICIFCNRAAIDLLGYHDEQELIGKNMHLLIHHHHRDGVHYELESCPIFRAFQENRSSHVDGEVFWRKDGSSFDVEYWSQPMILEHAVQGAVITFLDISTRRKMDERLDRLGRMLDASHDAMIVWSEDGGIESWNTGAKELYGFSAEEVVGKRAHELLHSDFALPREEYWRQIQTVGEWTGIVRQSTKDGRELLVSTRHQLWKRGGRTLVFEINRDVTDEQVFREEIERAHAAAEKANAAKSEFLANISHELRTPMTAVLGFADMLEAELNDEVQLEKVRTISRNGEYLLALLNDILDLSKIEAGKVDLNLEPVNVVKLVEDIGSLMSVRAKEEGVPLRIQYRERIPTQITGDKIRIRQIVVNLVSNALKFTNCGEVRLEVWLQEANQDSSNQATLHFDVIDTGIGISDQQKNLLFRPFTQASRDTSLKYGGTGLGLSISKRLAEAMKGTISVVSEAGKGSTFTLSLPVGALDQSKLISPTGIFESDLTSNATEEPGPASLALAKILLADDRRDVWRVVKYFLEKHGATVTVAEDGRQAVDEAQRARSDGRPFDLMLIDMQMPVMNGREAVQTLRAEGFTVPIIALTADAMTGNKEICIEFGCTDYFPKPINAPELVRLISGLLKPN